MTCHNEFRRLLLIIHYYINFICLNFCLFSMVQIACPEFRKNRHLIISLCINIFTWRFHSIQIGKCIQSGDKQVFIIIKCFVDL